jgi:hypothetical protein
MPPPPRPANTTKNPFTKHAPQHIKRALETGEGENYIFGNVRQRVKRTRVGASLGRYVSPPY